MYGTILSAFGGVKDVGHERGPCLRLSQGHEPRHGPRQQSKLRQHHVTEWQSSRYVHVSLLLTAFSSSAMTLNTGNEPFCRSVCLPACLSACLITHRTFARHSSAPLPGDGWARVFSSKPRVGLHVGLCPALSVMAMGRITLLPRSLGHSRARSYMFFFF